MPKNLLPGRIANYGAGLTVSQEVDPWLPDKFDLRRSSVLSYNPDGITPGQLASLAILQHIAPYFSLWAGLPGIQDLMQQIDAGVPLETLRQLPKEVGAYDPRFVDLISPQDLFLRAILENKEYRKIHMRRLRSVVELRTKTRLEYIREYEVKNGEPPLGELGIIGGGPATLAITGATAGLIDTTVISTELGGTFKDLPITLNSSLETDGISPDLPLQKGSSTPITPGIQNLPTLFGSELLKDEAREVVCNDGTTRRYAPAPPICDIVEAEIDATATHIINGQTVSIASTRSILRKDGVTSATRVSFVDNETGETYRHDFRAVVFATGGGVEESQVQDNPTKELYKNEKEELFARIQIATGVITTAKAELELLLNNPAVVSSSRVEELRKIIAEAAKKVTLPKVWSLAALKALYGFWKNTLDKDDDLWPFYPLYVPVNENPVSFFGAGLGDGQKTFIEFLQVTAFSKSESEEFYPKGFREKVRGKNPTLRAPSFIVNGAPTNDVRVLTNDILRLRYADSVFVQGVIPEKSRVLQYRRDGNSIGVVTQEPQQGRLQRRNFDYISDCTGLSKILLEEILRNDCGFLIDLV